MTHRHAHTEVVASSWWPTTTQEPADFLTAEFHAEKMKKQLLPPSTTPSQTLWKKEQMINIWSCFKRIFFKLILNLSELVESPQMVSSARLTCTVYLPLQAMWQYSNSYDLLRPYRSFSCEVAWACIRSGCSCWEGTGWRAGGCAAQSLRCAAPTCHLCGHLASSCGERHRTPSHCHGLQEMPKS